MEKLSSNEIVQGDLRGEAERMVASMSSEIWREGLTMLLVQEARGVWRSRNLKAELAAQRSPVPTSVDPRFKLTGGAKSHGSGKSRNRCQCEECIEGRRQSEEIGEKYDKWMFEEMRKITEKYKQELKMEWTEELLSTGFALPNGTIITWGAATVSQHQERVQMLTLNAHRNAEAAARHLKAIEAIEAASATTLAEVLPA